MAYERINWQNEPSEATALNDVNLNKMDSAIYELDGKATTTETAITALQDGKVDKVNGKGLSQVDNVTVTQHVAYGTVVSTIKTYGQDGTEVTSQVCNGIVVDSALSNSSTNPVQNKVVKSAIDEKSTVAISDTLETGTTLANITIDGTTTAIKGSDIEVDEELSPTSTNPVENKAIYDALNNLLPSKTVSGNPISISDASGFNAKALTVSMNPIQDLHGYSNPWAGGAGKNKCNPDGISVFNSNKYFSTLNYSTTPMIPVKSSTQYVLSCRKGMPSVTQDFKIYYWDSNNIAISNEKANPFTTPSNCVAISFYCGYSDGDFTDGDDVKAQVEEGSTFTSFAPYSNICPISGRTEASVTRTAGEDVETKTHQYSDTIYGGVDDFVNGGATSIYGYVDMSTLTWEKFADESYGMLYYTDSLSAVAKTLPLTENHLICSHYYGVSNQGHDGKHQLPNGAMRINNIGRIYVDDESSLTLAEFETKIANGDLCYELATPTTISTSAEEITLLKGNNVLSTNADDMELKYSVSLDSLLTT